MGVPIYEYRVREGEKGCEVCGVGFDEMQRLSDAPLAACPRCGAAVVKQISAPSIGGSKSGLDDRAKSAGFTKLKKLGKGEYEKQY